jgi:hypothetical protein
MRLLRLFPILLILSPALFAGSRHSNVSLSIDDGEDPTSCSDLNVRFDGERAPVRSQSIPFSGNSLRIDNEKHGGIRVMGARGSGWAITACTAVAPEADANAISVQRRGDEIVTTGPDEDRYIVYFLVSAPRGSSVDVSSTNGPISFDEFEGTANARAVNGPISVKESSGNINAATTNGPVSISGGSGTVKLTATNGPVSVDLDGSGWNGSLDASTTNGPVSLKVPRGYRSGILVEALGHGPISCRAQACPDTRLATDDDEDQWGTPRRPRRIELGGGPQVIRLATTNGPVSVKEN